MELVRINVYINFHLWKYFSNNQKISFTIEDVKDVDEVYISQISFGEGETFTHYEKWKIIIVKVDPNLFRDNLYIRYSLYLITDSGIPAKYSNTIHFVSPQTHFFNKNSKVICYYEHDFRDYFAEFYFLPISWNIGNHKYWPTEFKREVVVLLFILNNISLSKKLNFYKDMKYLIISELSKLHKY